MSSAVATAPVRYHWTRRAFHRAVAAGAFGDDDVQLRHGEVVRRVSPRGPRHAAAVQRLVALVPARLAHAGGIYQARVQDPIARTDDDEPEPDLAIVRAGDYDSDHPGPGDVVLVVEVADSSFAADRRKVGEYAQVAIPEAWTSMWRAAASSSTVAPTRPRRTYADVTTLTEGTLSIAGIGIDVAELFPARR